jgi:hypothetical protein
MMSASTWPGPTEGNWSISPDDQQRRRIGERLQQLERVPFDWNRRYAETGVPTHP